MAVKNWTGIDNYDAAKNISRERKFELLSSNLISSWKEN